MGKLAILSILIVIFVETVDSIQFSQYDNKCRNVTNLKKTITVFKKKTVNQCVEKCWRRLQCKSAMYKRLYLRCELYDIDISTLEPERMGTSCVVIKRDDIKLDGTEVHCNL